MANKARTFTLLADAGHGWLSVSHGDIRALGLEHKITTCSHVNGTRVFLEEDCDAPMFLKAAEAAGWNVTLKYKVCEADYSWIRDLPHYHHSVIEIPLKVGTVCKSGSGLLKVVSIARKIILEDINGWRYGVPKSNPYAYLMPTTKRLEPKGA